MPPPLHSRQNCLTLPCGQRFLVYVGFGGGGMSVESVLDDAIAAEHTAGWHAGLIYTESYHQNIEMNAPVAVDAEIPPCGCHVGVWIEPVLV